MAALNVTDNNFRSEVLESNVPVLVDFWAPHCGPCRAMGPTVDELADELAGQVKVVKVNVYDAPESAASYGVTSIPAFVVVKDGEATNKLVGMQPKEQLVASLQNAS